MTSTKDIEVTSRQGAHHQSAIETILDGCSWSYYLNNILQIETSPKPYSLVGTNFHSAIELHELARIAELTPMSLEDMIDYAITNIKKDIDKIPQQFMVDKKGDQLDLYSMVSSALTNWYSAPLKDGAPSHREWLLQFKPVAIEPYFKVSLVTGADPIAGWIDGVYQKEDGTYFIVDQKTAGDFSRWNHSGDGHRYQATMYAVALILSEDFPEIKDLSGLEMHYLVSRTRVGNVEKARRIIVKPELDDVSLLGSRIREVETIVANNLYKTKTDSPLCSPRFCSFYEGCQVTGTLAPKEKVNE